MKRIAGMLLLTALVSATGCDPGFTVRQADTSPERHPALPNLRPQVVLEVGKFHALVGSAYYGPKIRVANLSDRPIVVTGIELVTEGGIYVSSPPQGEIGPGATREIATWFELKHGIHTAFKKSAELRVHYSIGNNSETASTMLLGKVAAVSEP